MVPAIPASGSEFQFTHPGGVRPNIDPTILSPKSFNSRTREGCDGATTSLLEINLTFQFTHPGGVRLGEVPPQ